MSHEIDAVIKNKHQTELNPEAIKYSLKLFRMDFKLILNN